MNQSIGIKYFLLTAFIGVLFFSACNKSKSKVPEGFELPVAYAGILPCADCEGILYELYLNADYTYKEKMLYQGKSGELFEDSGKWSVKDDTVIVLGKKQPGQHLFSIEFKRLRMLDIDGNIIAGALSEAYVLQKGLLSGLQNKSVASNTVFDKKRNAGIDFVAFGNEPSWSLEIDFEKNLHFTTPDGIDLSFLLMEPAFLKNGHVIEYITGNANTQFSVRILNANCTDLMSGEILQHIVQITMNNTNYNGCGKYISPQHNINGSWKLTSINNTEIKQQGDLSKIPEIAFNVIDSSFSGNNSCNAIQGKYVISEKDITFPANTIGSTKMYCEDSMEALFMKTLQSGPFKYQQTNNKLILSGSENMNLTFTRR